MLVYRAVPVRPALLDSLDLVHGIREVQASMVRVAVSASGRGPHDWLRVVQAVMGVAELSGLHACLEGPRHGFGAAAVSAGIPLNLMQRWPDHPQFRQDDLRQYCGR